MRKQALATVIFRSEQPLTTPLLATLRKLASYAIKRGILEIGYDIIPRYSKKDSPNESATFEITGFSVLKGGEVFELVTEWTCKNNFADSLSDDNIKDYFTKSIKDAIKEDALLIYLGQAFYERDIRVPNTRASFTRVETLKEFPDRPSWALCQVLVREVDNVEE